MAREASSGRRAQAGPLEAINDAILGLFGRDGAAGGLCRDASRCTAQGCAEPRTGAAEAAHSCSAMADPSGATRGAEDVATSAAPRHGVEQGKGAAGEEGAKTEYSGASLTLLALVVYLPH